MKTWKRALALVLALVMALSLVALPSFAEGEETGGGNDGMPYIEENGHGGKVEKDGLVMSKTIKKTGDSQFLLTLEAFATGTTTTTTTTDPVDIVLVLDVSGSMDENLMNYTYNSVYNPKTNGRTIIIRMKTVSISRRTTAMASMGCWVATMTLAGTHRTTRAGEVARANLVGA